MAIPNDTHPDAARVQLELYRKMGTAGRLSLMCRLTDDARAMARRAIAKRHPDLSEEERRLVFIELHYGRDLAERVRACVASRSR